VECAGVQPGVRRVGGRWVAVSVGMHGSYLGWLDHSQRRGDGTVRLFIWSAPDTWRGDEQTRAPLWVMGGWMHPWMHHVPVDI
jgi:hypothetical protein